MAWPDAVSRNQVLELKRNAERYAFLRWGAQAFDNLRIVPPGNGILHQINLEYLARVVWTADGVAYPDSVLGMDSHTAMINSLGILGWGVGGLEGGAGALGESVAMLVPEVIGCRLVGKPRPGVTSTDIVLTVTQTLRRHKVVDKFVEYFGPGVAELSLPDRATIANMSPENGATMGFFPVDAETLRYLRLTGRDEAQVALVEAYCKAQGLWRDAGTPPAEFTAVVEIDLSAVEPSVAGPSRPQDRGAAARSACRRSERLVPETERKKYGRRHRHCGDHELHQHFQPFGHDRRRPAGAQRRSARAQGAPRDQDFACRPARAWWPTISRKAACRRRSTRSASSSPDSAA